jgi:hypothetical protein
VYFSKLQKSWCEKIELEDHEKYAYHQIYCPKKYIIEGVMNISVVMSMLVIRNVKRGWHL